MPATPPHRGPLPNPPLSPSCPPHQQVDPHRRRDTAGVGAPCWRLLPRPAVFRARHTAGIAADRGAGAGCSRHGRHRRRSVRPCLASSKLMYPAICPRARAGCCLPLHALVGSARSGTERPRWYQHSQHTGHNLCAFLPVPPSPTPSTTCNALRHGALCRGDLLGRARRVPRGPPREDGAGGQGLPVVRLLAHWWAEEGGGEAR